MGVFYADTGIDVIVTGLNASRRSAHMGVGLRAWPRYACVSMSMRLSAGLLATDIECDGARL